MESHRQVFIPRTHPSLFRNKWVWVVPPLVMVGVIAGIVITSLGGHKHGSILAIVGPTLIVTTLVVFALGFSKLIGHARTMMAHLHWWHGLWFLAFASALVFRLRVANDIQQNPVDAWAMYRISLEAIVAAILLIRLALRRTPWFGSMFRGFIGVLTVFGLIELASTAWSVYPPWTMYKSCEYLLDVAILAAVLATIQSVEAYKHFFNWTWTLYGLLLFSVWLGVVIWPQQALYSRGFKIGLLGARLNGVLPALSANDVGTFAAILGVIALSRLLPIAGGKGDRVWWLLLLGASSVTMVFSQTRSAIAGFLFGAFLILLFSKRMGVSALLSFVVAPLLVLSSVGGMVWAFLERGQDVQQLETLSSRADWWSFAWQKFLDRPLMGFGAYAAGRFAVLAQHGLGGTSTMHSDYLEMIVGTGIWGLIPFLIALIGVWWFLIRYLRHSTVRKMDQQLAYEAVAVLGLLSFRSIFMTMLTWHPPLHYLAILGYAEYLRRRRLRPNTIQVGITRQTEPDFATASSST